MCGICVFVMKYFAPMNDVEANNESAKSMVLKYVKCVLLTLRDRFLLHSASGHT